MKVLFILALVLAVTLAAPTNPRKNDDGSVKVNRRYSLRKTHSSRDAAPKDQSSLLAQEGIGAEKNPVTSKGSAKKKIGTKPFGEPENRQETKTTAVEPPVFPPKAVEPTTPAVPEVPSAAPTTVAPSPVVTQAAPVETTPVPSPPPPNVQKNNTGTATSSGEDDSSSEEDDEDDYDDDEDDDGDDDDDDDGRQLFPLNSKNDKGQVQPEKKKVASPVVGDPKPLKVNAFVTQTGQILVPIETFQEYFDFPAHVVVPPELDYRSYPAEPDGYIVSRQESVGSSEEESSDSNNVATKDEEVDSEESAPVRVSSTKVVYEKPNKKNSKPKEKVQVESAESGNSEEANEDKDVELEEKPVRGNTESAESSVSIETEEKNTSVETVSPAPVRTQPEQGPVGRPPLAVIPATNPTNEDDEEEAGRHFFISPVYEPYYDTPDYDNEYFYQ